MPVLTRLMTKRRPGKRFSARKVPRGIPRSRLISVAEIEICSDSRVIRQTSELPERRSQNACLVPVKIRCMFEKRSAVSSQPSRQKRRIAERENRGCFFHTAPRLLSPFLRFSDSPFPRFPDSADLYAGVLLPNKLANFPRTHFRKERHRLIRIPCRTAAPGTALSSA